LIRQVMWTAWEDPGLGHLRLAVRDSGVIADGIALGLADGRPFRLAYGEGNWATSDGRAVAYLEGCGYVDISETPYTNTLPIRRLCLAPGESADVSVAYIDGYELQPWPEPQRYTRLEEDDGGGMYRFVSLDGGFTADLRVDSDGLVVDYPRLFKRVLG
jgi:hypothetical protein